MVLDIMSAPPLPQRGRPSQKGRPLPSTPQDRVQPLTSTPSIKDRKLPPPPQDHLQPVTNAPPIKDRKLPPPPPSDTNHTPVSPKPVRQGTRQVNPPSTLDTTGQKKRPLPPPPADEQTVSSITKSAQNGDSTLLRAKQRTPIDSSKVNSSVANTKRPLPPPPTEDTGPSIPPSNRPIQVTKETLNVPKLPERKSSLHGPCNDENDYEKRFIFHDVKDFPPPEEFSDKPKKYSSTSQQSGHNRRRKRASPR